MGIHLRNIYIKNKVTTKVIIYFNFDITFWVWFHLKGRVKTFKEYFLKYYMKNRLLYTINEKQKSYCLMKVETRDCSRENGKVRWTWIF